MRLRLSLVGFLGGASMLAFGCINNPVHDDEVTALGPEARGVTPGPLHRPGQPCLVCHGTFGPAWVEFSVGGTVYVEAGQATPAIGAVVSVEDITGASFATATNAAGNFYVLLRDFSPAFPILPRVVSADGGVAQTMMTYVARNGSCAACHSNPPGATSAGPVVLFTVLDGGAGAKE
jgi:hypothetical protein